jgi:hypothetical protein
MIDAKNPYGLPVDVPYDPARFRVPEEGARIGVRYFGTETWTPFTVVMVAARCVVMTSPINHSRFRFGRDGTWTWQEWDACPALMEACGRCKGTGVILNKKSQAEQSCPKCRGKAQVKRDDPFETPH